MYYFDSLQAGPCLIGFPVFKRNVFQSGQGELQGGEQLEELLCDSDGSGPCHKTLGKFGDYG